MEGSKAAYQGQLLVGVAVTGSRKCKHILKWAAEKFRPEGNVTFKILHVYPKINLVPTLMGTWLPVTQVREEVVAGYRKDVQGKKLKKLLPYYQILKEQKIKSDIALLESDDIAMALSLETTRLEIRHLVIGISSGGIFSMKNFTLAKGEDLSQVISETAPNFCTVYVVADGKLQQLRPADSEQNTITTDDTNKLSSVSTNSSSSSSSLTTGRLLKNKASSPRYGGSLNSSPSPSQRKLFESHQSRAAAPTTLTREAIELKLNTFKDPHASARSLTSSSGDSGSWISDQTPEGSFVHSETLSPLKYLSTPPPTEAIEGTNPAITFPATRTLGSYMSTPSTVSSLADTSPAGTPLIGSSASIFPGGTPPEGSYLSNPPVGTPSVDSDGTTLGVLYGSTPPNVSFTPLNSEDGASPNQIDSELEKLRKELQRIEKMYALTQNNTIDEKLQEISKDRLDVALKLKEEKVQQIAKLEKNKSREAQSETEEEKDGRNQRKKKEDTKATKEAEESKNELFASPAIQYQKFTWDEIVEATSSLSDEYKIGMGAFGTVYKCKLHHTTVAVKVLHSKDSVTNKQFFQELEILSTIRHPHLLLLLGAVPEESCLIYEYMDHGSLDDQLFRKNNKPPLPWYDRFRICCEVAGALAFLHSTKPRPIIHRDLKPANILLDHNLVSKIGDAGLGTMINVEPTNLSLKTIYKETNPVGTLCYIDPEYQRTGRVSPKSDIYALGVVILQLLTAKPAVGIAFAVEDAIDENTLTKVLDPEAGEWPVKETLELAQLGLQCAELRGRDRPDLREKVLPLLERLKEMADNARASNSQSATPAHFLCPLLKDVMEDPYVAADGYTYDRRAIEQWLKENDTSPTTTQPLPHKFIMPNTTMLEAIKQWKSKRPSK